VPSEDGRRDRLQRRDLQPSDLRIALSGRHRYRTKSDTGRSSPVRVEGALRRASEGMFASRSGTGKRAGSSSRDRLGSTALLRLLIRIAVRPGDQGDLMPPRAAALNTAIWSSREPLRRGRGDLSGES
jgi:hypothetical protein